MSSLVKIIANKKQSEGSFFICNTRTVASSETQGQLVGAGKNLKTGRVMFFYSIESGMQNFRRFCRKKENHLRSSLGMVLRSPPQLI